MLLSLFFLNGFRYEQRDSHEFLSDLVDFLHDELASSPTPPEAAAALAVTSGSSMGTSIQEHGEGIAENQNCASTTIVKNDRTVLLPTDEYFQLNVRVCLECDSCGYSR